MPHQSNLDMAWLHSSVVLIHRKQHNYQLDNMNIKLTHKTEVSNPWKTTNRWSSHSCNSLNPQKSQKQLTAMYKPCKHEMSNWSKWFDHELSDKSSITVACMYNSSNKNSENETFTFQRIQITKPNWKVVCFVCVFSVAQRLAKRCMLFPVSQRHKTLPQLKLVSQTQKNAPKVICHSPLDWSNYTNWLAISLMR